MKDDKKDYCLDGNIYTVEIGFNESTASQRAVIKQGREIIILSSPIQSMCWNPLGFPYVFEDEHLFVDVYWGAFVNKMLDLETGELMPHVIPLLMKTITTEELYLAAEEIKSEMSSLDQEELSIYRAFFGQSEGRSVAQNGKARRFVDKEVIAAICKGVNMHYYPLPGPKHINVSREEK